jgi:ATP-dependent metalloprotease FtsH
MRFYRNRLTINTVSKFLKGHKKTILTGVLLCVSFVLLVGFVSRLPAPVTSGPPARVTVVNYLTFVGQVKAGNVRTVTIQGDEVTSILLHSLHGESCIGSPQVSTRDSFVPKKSIRHFNSSCAIYSHLPATGDSTLLPLLLRHGVVINALSVKEDSFAWQGLLWVPVVIILALLILMKLIPRKDRSSFDAVDENLSQFLKGRVRRFERTQENSKSGIVGSEASPLSEEPAASAGCPKSPVTLADVAGIDEVRAELEEVVQFLRSPAKFNRLGAHIPRGILLVGPPGTGKTLLAKAVAGEANVPFFHMSASEFVEMFVGVGASRVRELFQQARQSAPCVIFLDEIDAVGRKRSLRVPDSGERDQTLNQLLVELDGFEGRSTVVVLAATNRVDMLDGALLRPGRFDRQIAVSLPDRAGREAILRVHARRTPLDEGVRLDLLARLTTGMSGADLSNLVNEAALCAARRGLDKLMQDCFEEALARIQLGARRPLVLSEADQRIIAFHESGHALVAYYVPEADPVSSITILPRGQHLGVTQFTAEEDRYNYSRETLMARIAVGLGGRVAEELTFGPDGVTTGAENDLQAITALAWRMVTRWGMGKQVGNVFADYCEASGGVNLNNQANAVPMQPGSAESKRDSCPLLVEGKVAAYRHGYAMNTPATRYVSSPEMAALIDSEVQHILNEGRAIASNRLTEHYAQLTKLAQELLEHEQLDREEFEAVLRE